MSNGQVLPQLPQYSSTVHQPQPQTVPQTTYAMPQGPKPVGDARPIPGIMVYAIATISIAFLMCILGIVAVIIEANHSYVGDPIWTAVIFILPTGILGLVSYTKRTSVCVNVSYLVCSIIVCVVCSQLILYASINAVSEWRFCNPSPDYSYHDYDDICQFDRGGRIAVDSLIALLAFGQLVLCIISLSFTCYGTFACCYNCCRPPPPPAVIQLTDQNNTCQLTSVGGYQPGNVMVGHNGQAFTPVQARPQPAVVPAIPTQMRFVQLPTFATPGNVINPSVPAAVGPYVTGSQPQQPLTTNHQQHQLGTSVPYGQTSTGQFHDQKNMLETA